MIAILSLEAHAADCASLLDNIRAELQRKNPIIEYVQVVDTKPKHTKYWVLARGIRKDLKFEGAMEDELFGLFIANGKFTAIDEVVDIFPTKRWMDYSVWIESHSLDKVTVRGHGATYKDSGFEKAYDLAK